jgi:hypothetical protein
MQMILVARRLATSMAERKDAGGLGHLVSRQDGMAGRILFNDVPDGCSCALFSHSLDPKRK